MSKRFAFLAATIILGFLILRCSSGQDFNASLAVPTPIDNPQSLAKIALGRQLFFDKRLSIAQLLVQVAMTHKKHLQTNFLKVAASKVNSVSAMPRVCSMQPF